MADKGEVRLRSADELTPEERLELDRQLDSGVTELPPNQPKGILGERGIDVRRVDTFEPDLNAGILQENDPGVMWLWIVLAYLLFFPVAYVLLWRSTYIPRRTKLLVSVVGAVGIAAFVLRFWVA